MDNNVALNYVKRKKRRKRAAWISFICSIGITVMIIISFCIIYVDRFTIKTTEANLCLTLDPEENDTTTILTAHPDLKVTDTQYTNIPEDIEHGISDKSTYNYFAYSFYLGTRDATKDISYVFTMSLRNATKNLDDAVVVMLIKDGVKQLYAKNREPLYNGNPYTKEKEEYIAAGYVMPFLSDDYIITTSDRISPDNYYKYTVVMWIDGWKSEDSMKGGTFVASIDFITGIY